MKIRSRWMNIVLSVIGTWCMRALFLTVRVDHRSVVAEASPYRRASGAVRYAFCLWHDYIVTAVFASGTYQLSGLISQHRDGSYLADSARIAGIRPVRGSASRGGAEAVRELLDMPEYHVAITPDGPRGPRRVMKEGIVFIAARSGRPVVPTAVLADRFWTIRGSWTTMQIPKPFSRALLIAGRPMEVPSGIERDDLQPWVRALQTEMERLESVALRIISGDQAASGEIDCCWMDGTTSRRTDGSQPDHVPETRPRAA